MKLAQTDKEEPQTPVTDLSGVGPSVAEHLSKLGIVSIIDLLFHLPLRYEDRTYVQSIGCLQNQGLAVVEAKIELSEIVYRRRRSLLCRVSDGTGILTARFFYFSRAQQQQLKRGQRISLVGNVRQGASGPEMIHPEYKLLKDGETSALSDSLTPVYPVTKGLQQTRLRRFVAQALDRLNNGQLSLPELPAAFVEEQALMPLHKALNIIHHPPAEESFSTLSRFDHPAQQRLIMEELIAYLLSLRLARLKVRKIKGPKLPEETQAQNALQSVLGFQLTDAQKKVWQTITADMASAVPMMRLVQGDVGSGKTVVAALAASQALAAGGQVALMAPTELLAEQHYQTFSTWFASSGYPVVRLSGRLSAKDKRAVLQVLNNEQPVLAIGTHALFQVDVQFANLVLAIIDEQHRFGVHQRLALTQKLTHKNVRPHQLIMTATPIPRTLSMTAYADLDISVIDELPPGRLPIKTAVISQDRRQDVIERVRHACQIGGQAYWVCTAIEESEEIAMEAVETIFEKISSALKEFKVGLIHGRLRSSEKESVMGGFVAGDIRILVATTVVEVGVDVSNASLMIIENAERLGLAQLHQLRGRVGRGQRASHCVLLYKSPLSKNARARLSVMRDSQDGFYIAQQDLTLRGPGEVLGVRQTGLPSFKIADLIRDARLVPKTLTIVDQLLEQHPQQAAKITHLWMKQGLAYSSV